LEEAADVGQEGHHHAEGELAAGDGQSAEPENDGCGQHAQELDGRQEDKGQRHSCHVSIPVGAVDLVKALV
jgi:hypothetical protein